MNELWGSEEFENLVVTAIIAMYEKKSKRKMRNPVYKVTDSDMVEIKRRGLFFSPPDRLIAMEDDAPILYSGGITSIHEMSDDADVINSYLDHVYFRRTQNRLKPEFIHPPCPGFVYDIFQGAFHQTDGLIITKNYVFHGTDGKIYPVYYRNTQDFPFPKKVKENADLACDLLKISNLFLLDMQYLWNVEIHEEIGKSTFGIYEEQIKSLFYSRTLPLTSTGRKRPILHWCSAHRRRIKEGIEIDIEKYLRGITEFEMDGVKYKITTPAKRQS